MDRLSSLIQRGGDVGALNYWGAFGYQVEEWLINFASAEGLKYLEDCVVSRDYEVGARAISKPISISVFSQRVLALKPSEIETDLDTKLVRVGPASMWFSIGADGGVIAFVTPFEVEGLKPPFERYVVGVLSKPQRLSRRWLKQCWRRYVQIASATHPNTTPSQTSQNVIVRGLGRHNRLTGTPAQPNAAETYGVATSAVLVGLLATTVALIEFVKEYPTLTVGILILVAIAFIAVGWITFRRLRLFPH